MTGPTLPRRYLLRRQPPRLALQLGHLGESSGGGCVGWLCVRCVHTCGCRRKCTRLPRADTALPWHTLHGTATRPRAKSGGRRRSSVTAKAVAAGGDWSYLVDHTQEVPSAPKGAKAQWAAMKSTWLGALWWLGAGREGGGQLKPRPPHCVTLCWCWRVCACGRRVCAAVVDDR